MIQDSMQFAAVESGLRFYQAYDQSLSLWPIESEAFYVSTRFGKTHIIASGPKDAPSLILLHGGLFRLCDVVSEYRSVEQSISYICGRYNRRQK